MLGQEQKKIRKEKLKEAAEKTKVHAILTHSYSFYFISFLLGIFFDFIFQYNIFNYLFLKELGFILLILSGLLILWAQKTSRNLKKEASAREEFYKGPYRFSRSPTHWGLAFLMLGFGFLTNGFFVVIFTIISFFITKLIFLRQEENILEKKYGVPYMEYKKKVLL